MGTPTAEQIVVKLGRHPLILTHCRLDCLDAHFEAVSRPKVAFTTLWGMAVQYQQLSVAICGGNRRERRDKELPHSDQETSHTRNFTTKVNTKLSKYNSNWQHKGREGERWKK